MSALKTRYQIPEALQSCHTAIVGGYLVEGHVPAPEIERLLRERPAFTGIAVPGMPIGSPGMEVQGAEATPYDVIAWDKTGKRMVFAHYPQT